MPIQASLLLRLGGGRVAPFLLGGPGWYKRTVKPLDGSGDDVSETEFGWHAGVGLEIRRARHFGIHGDYRYTFLDFSDDDDEDEGFIGGLLPGHRGSMWTLGPTGSLESRIGWSSLRTASVPALLVARPCNPEPGRHEVGAKTVQR